MKTLLSIVLGGALLLISPTESQAQYHDYNAYNNNAYLNRAIAIQKIKSPNRKRAIKKSTRSRRARSIKRTKRTKRFSRSYSRR